MRIFASLFVSFLVSSAATATAQIHLDLSSAQVEVHPPERLRLRQLTVPGHPVRYWVDLQWDATGLVFVPVDYGAEGPVNGGGFTTCPQVLLNFGTQVNLCDILEVQSEVLLDVPSINACHVEVRLRNKTSSFLVVSLIYRYFGAGTNQLAPSGVAGTISGGETKTLTGVALSFGEGPCSKIVRFEAYPEASFINGQ